MSSRHMRTEVIVSETYFSVAAPVDICLGERSECLEQRWSTVNVGSEGYSQRPAHHCRIRKNPSF